MDGRLVTILAFFVLPSALIGLTVVEFHSNPVSILLLIGVMVVGVLYLLSYTESFA